MILNGRTEGALRLLSKHYGVREPRLRVGTIKGHRKVLGCYVEKEQQIYLSNSSFIKDPFVVLHEFYHHVRASGVGRRRQVESRADLFAVDFLRDFITWKRSMGEKV
jgi:Zn-dependent peptidase ImmA (M78 family)